MFTPEQRNHLDVLGIWAVFRTQLYTDDSFAFTKVIKQLTSDISALEAVQAVDDEVLQVAMHGQVGAEDSPVLQEAAVQVAGSGGGGGSGGDKKGAAAAAARETSGVVAVENNDTSSAQEGEASNTEHTAAEVTEKGTSITTSIIVWDDAQATVARRQALLDCMLAAKDQYVHVCCSVLPFYILYTVVYIIS